MARETPLMTTIFLDSRVMNHSRLIVAGNRPLDGPTRVRAHRVHWASIGGDFAPRPALVYWTK